MIITEDQIRVAQKQIYWEVGSDRTSQMITIS